MPPAPPKSRICPNCNTTVPATRSQCPSCKLATSKMDGFAAAKNAALKKGLASTTIEREGTAAWPYLLRPGTLMKGLVLAALIVACIWFFKPKPPRYLQLPASGNEAVQKFLADISGGSDKDFGQAYALVPDSVRDPKSSDERGDYLQIFDVMSNYFSGEFGSDWLTQTKLAPDPADPNVIIAKVALETLHIHVGDQTPADKKATEGPHFGILGVDEFELSWAKDFRQMEGIKGFVRGMAGQGAVDNLNLIIGASANNMHAAPMVKKVGLLAVIRNPHTITWRSALQTYPFRDDPVVRNRLTQILNDARYEDQIKEKAKEVLDDKVPDEEKNALGL